MTLQVGIDVGGTFTDIVVFDAESQNLHFLKVPSTKPPELGVLNGLREIESRLNLSLKKINRIVHGSTVATNALLEGRWAKTALITTEGFRDVLEIGRQNRPSLYDFNVERPAPLVARALRFEVSERLDFEGHVIRALDENRLSALIPELQNANVEAIAVCFLFSYLNSSHEQRVKALLQSDLKIPVICSSDLLPEYREYERTSTTVMSAALRPVVGAYIEKLEGDVRRLGVAAPLEIMQSNGGLVSAKDAASHAESLLYSGPAGGVAGSHYVGSHAGFENLITFDMGGTSCDVSLISEGRVLQRVESELAGYKIRVPMADIHSVGAGGGSVARIDSGGVLQVGPESAGSDPGPACYGRGHLPTVTDAQLVLGRFDPEMALGGRKLDFKRALAAIEQQVAKPLKISVQEAALGILEIADACMERAIRVITVERGHDPRAYALLAFGGGGPLHAPSVAERLGIQTILVPVTAGVLSALGTLTSDIRRDLVQSILKPTAASSPTEITMIFEKMQREAVSSLKPNTDISFRHLIEIRYRGQAYELPIEISAQKMGKAKDSQLDLIALERLFHKKHEQLYGYSLKDNPAEIVSLRLEATARTKKPRLPKYSEKDSSAPQPRAERKVLFGKKTRRCPVFSREILRTGHRLQGPAIIEGPESTVLIPPDWQAQVDAWGNLILEK